MPEISADPPEHEALAGPARLLNTYLTLERRLLSDLASGLDVSSSASLSDYKALRAEPLSRRQTSSPCCRCGEERVLPQVGEQGDLFEIGFGYGSELYDGQSWFISLCDGCAAELVNWLGGPERVPVMDWMDNGWKQGPYAPADSQAGEPFALSPGLVLMDTSAGDRMMVVVSCDEHIVTLEDEHGTRRRRQRAFITPEHGWAVVV